MTRISNTPTTPTTKRKTILIGDYIREERLGRGSFASVYKARHKVSNEIVAIKDIYVEKMPEKNLEAEISIMRKIQHSCIVQLKDCIRTTSHVYLVMEYCSLGDLNTWLKEKNIVGNGMCEQDLIHFLVQMASGLKYLRTRNFVHRDIKPQNILLVPSTTNPNGLPDIKISDFGFAKFLPNADLTSSFCGTPLYMAPEVLNRQKYDAKADLWSVGCLLYEMMMGRKLCQTNQMVELEQFLQNYNNQVDFTGSRFEFSQELKDLISVLLKKNPVDRASCEDFFHHVELLKIAKSPIMDPPRDEFTDTEEEEEEEVDEEDEYVVVIDIKKNNKTDSINSLADDFNNLTLDGQKKRYSTSAPPLSTSGQLYPQRRSLDPNQFSCQQQQQHVYRFSSSDDLTPLMIRERKFSVGSAGSVLTKALSKASTKIFGNGSSSSHSSGSSSTAASSPPSPVTPNSPSPSPTTNKEDDASQQTLVVEEVTLHKLLISSSSNTSAVDNKESMITTTTTTTTDEKDKELILKTDKLSEMIDAVESFADYKSKQSDEMPFDTILTAEVVVLYAKVMSLIQLQMDQLKLQHSSSSNYTFKKKQKEMMQGLQKRYDNNKKLSAYYSERCNDLEEQDDDLIVGTSSSHRTMSIEKLLYDRALELSKEAAVKQLIEEDLSNCARKYRRAILLLESIMCCHYPIFKKISKQDETILLNFINQIQARLVKVVAAATTA